MAKQFTPLPENLVRDIYADPGTHREIAARYGVHRGTVWRIKAGRAYGEVTGQDRAPVARDPRTFARGKAVASSRPGMRRPPQKLTADDVRYARQSSLPCRVVGELLGVSAMAISKIRRGIIWRHVA